MEILDKEQKENEIKKMKKEKNVNGLILALKNEDKSIRHLVPRALVKLRDKKAVEPLIQALGDDYELVRSAAARALGNLKDKRAVEPLIQALNDNEYVRSAAARALGNLKDKRAVEPLIQALNDDDKNVRSAAVSALGDLKDKRAVEPLIQALNDDDEAVRGDVVIALGQIGDKRAIVPLEKMLNDEDIDVQEYTKEALNWFNIESKNNDPIEEISSDVQDLREVENNQKLQLAKNYEKALRDNDALQIYEDLDSKEDIKRLKLKKVKQFEKLNQYEDAAKLYEDLDMWDEAGRVRRLALAPPVEKPLENVTPSRTLEQTNIIIKRGYSLTGDMFKFGVKVENNSNYKIIDVDVKLRVPEALTIINPKSSIFRIRSIDPNSAETATFLMRPIRCISGFIKGTVEYEDPISNEINMIKMNPKEIQSICPFVEPNPMPETEYIELLNELDKTNDFVQTGYSFTGSNIDSISNILFEKCSNMALISEHDMGTEKLLFFSGKSTVEKIQYLLTTAIREDDNMINIAFKGYSTKKEGLVGFLSEITDCIKYSIGALKTTQEVTKIEKNYVQNIIDSVLVRSKVEAGG